MRIPMALCMGVVCLVFTACGTPNGATGVAGQAGPSPVAIDADALSVGAVGPYNIPRGVCGMILYVRGGAAPVPVFRSTQDGKGIMAIEGALTPLNLVARGGEGRSGVPPMQYFEGALADGQNVRVAAETFWGTTFPGGTYVRGGTITVTSPNGWSRVLPVAGVAGCRAAQPA